jgi:hypothetical protein
MLATFFDYVASLLKGFLSLNPDSCRSKQALFTN